ncbi:MAG: membrane protein insertion efficiency factor YidD [Bdellovibrionales bacterium]|nr:membrane protein insertion efficiency factor YidD [Bdellovibrionales bacterium]
MGIFRGFLNILAVKCLLALIQIYRWTLAPILLSFGAQCRFYPSCSEYAREALHVHGPAKGTALMALRLARCHPFCEGGEDLVPGTEGQK